MLNNSETYSSMQVITGDSVTRGEFGAISSAQIPDSIKNLLAQVSQQAGWKTGITSAGMAKGGYEARNIEVYGYDTDRDLAVIQIRRSWKKKTSWFPSVSKAYALIGSDDGQIFSHPLAASPCRNHHLSTLSPADVVQWAESKIFGVSLSELATMVRQGDIALIPVKKLPPDLTDITSKYQKGGGGVATGLLRSSHRFDVDGRLLVPHDQRVAFVDGSIEIVHTKSQHKAISGTGKFRLVVGHRASNPWWIDTELGD